MTEKTNPPRRQTPRRRFERRFRHQLGLSRALMRAIGELRYPEED